MTDQRYYPQTSISQILSGLFCCGFFLLLNGPHLPTVTPRQGKVCGLEPNFTSNPCLEISPCPGCEQLSIDVASLVSNKECLAPDGSNDKNSQLTKYWAQEYIGADLAQEFLSQLGPEEQRQTPLVLFDDPNSSHASNTTSTLINRSSFLLLTPSSNLKIYPTANYADLKNALQQVLHQSVPPAVINQSAGEINSGLMPDYQRLLKNGTLVVYTAGNDYPRVSNVNPNTESLQDLILVGNSGPLGLAHSSSQESKKIAISAPAGAELYTGEGSSYFGGTSGASALVAATLAHVRAMAPQLSVQNAKDLLRLASIPTLLSQPPERTNGPGMLNMFKMLVVAKNIEQKCQGHHPLTSCYNQEFKRPQNYQNLINPSEKTKILQQFSTTFPWCAPNPPSSGTFSPLPCPQKIEAWKKIRQLSLLENDPTANKMLSCLYHIMGYPQNAFFYSGMNAKNRIEAEKLLLAHVKQYPSNPETTLAVSKAKYWKTLGELYRKGEAICSDPAQSSFFPKHHEQQQWAIAYQQSSRLDCAIKILGNYSSNSAQYQHQLKLIKAALLDKNQIPYRYDDLDSFYQLLTTQPYATDPMIIDLTNHLVRIISQTPLDDVLVRSSGFKVTGAFVDNSICDKNNHLPLQTKLDQIRLLHAGHPGEEQDHINALSHLGERIKDIPSDLSILRKYLNEIALWNHPDPQVRAAVLGHCSGGLEEFLLPEQRLAILQQFSQDKDDRVRKMVIQHLSCYNMLNKIPIPATTNFYFSLFEQNIPEDRSSCVNAIDFFANAQLSPSQEKKITDCKKVHGLK